ncbi:MAG: hypothetical protein JSS86_12300 [Cyanobacteria bacterium SZAS LIN-2]|nr:hypothetical protein [Cyanobacteria bacterium SZAS LIN-2]
MNRKQLLIAATGLTVCGLALVAPRLTASAAPAMIIAPTIAPHMVPTRNLHTEVSASSTAFAGVNTAGPLKIESLANTEKAINFGTTLTEVLGILLGLYYLLKAPMTEGATRGQKTRGYIVGTSLILLGLAAPGVVNLVVNFGSGCGSVF